MKRLGLFGGTFDPVHLGHLLVAQAALEELKLERIFFIPAAQSPFKPGRESAPAAMRLALLRLALAGNCQFEVDGQEIQRGGISYSVETVRAYAARYPTAQLFYLIGADHLLQLPKWRDAGQLATLTEFVVVPRPGEAPAALPPPFKGTTLAGFPLGVSASRIRERVRLGLKIDALVSPAVAEMIRNLQLYQAEN